MQNTFTIRVVKIGGTLLRTLDGFSSVADKIHQEKDIPWIIVISALGDTTRKLETAALHAEEGKIEAATAIFDEILHFHQATAEKLLSSETLQHFEHQISPLRQSLHRLFRGVSITNELTPRTLDKILSYGEFFATHLFSAFLLEQGIPHTVLPATEFMITDHTHLTASLNREATLERIQQRVFPLFHKTQLLLTQGFIGSAPNGEITTLGFESSNITAAVLAAALSAEELWIWTDVPGIQTADPKLVKSTKRIPELHYTTATFLAKAGLKLLHPQMVQLLEEFAVPARISSPLFHPSETTLIHTKEAGSLPIFLLKQQERWIYQQQQIFEPGKILFSNQQVFQFLPTENSAVLIILGVPLQHLLRSFPHSPSLHAIACTENPPITYVQLDKDAAIPFLIYLHQHTVENQPVVE